MPSNPVTPSSPTPEYGRDKPSVGSGEETKEPKPFSLSPEPSSAQSTEKASAQPSPMEAASQAAQQKPMSADELSEHMNKLKGQLDDAQTKLQDPTVTNKFTQDHYNALNKVTDKMNSDMHTIAKASNGKFEEPGKSSSTLDYVVKWINGSQQTLSSALKYVGSEKNPNPAQFLRLQYSVQRASQRGELFASVIGSSVSGIKTIMSTQLG